MGMIVRTKRGFTKEVSHLGEKKCLDLCQTKSALSAISATEPSSTGWMTGPWLFKSDFCTKQLIRFKKLLWNCCSMSNIVNPFLYSMYEYGPPIISFNSWRLVASTKCKYQVQVPSASSSTSTMYQVQVPSASTRTSAMHQVQTFWERKKLRNQLMYYAQTFWKTLFSGWQLCKTTGQRRETLHKREIPNRAQVFFYLLISSLFVFEKIHLTIFFSSEAKYAGTIITTTITIILQIMINLMVIITIIVITLIVIITIVIIITTCIYISLERERLGGKYSCRLGQEHRQILM